jgi:hypothetical protein
VQISPVLLLEPTVTFEKDATAFEATVGLDLSTPFSRVEVTLEATTKPFSDGNDVDLESELNFVWLESDETGGWLSSHFDIVDQFSAAERPTDSRAYTHKLNFELDTSFALFQRLRDTHWLHDVEIEGSLDYLATGLPGTGQLQRIVFKEKWEELRREPMLQDLKQRMRDVRQGPDGLLYVLTAEDEGAVLRIEPAYTR